MKNPLLPFFLPLALFSQTAMAIEQVDVELQLLIDISGSVNSTEYQLQMDGYKAAFESDTVQNSIINGTNGQIAVQLVMWSGANQQEVMIDWSLIDSSEASNNFATTIDSLARPFSGMTAIGNAINYGYTLFENNNFQGLSQVIDVSGDGTNNNGSSPSTARDNALAAGIDKINGIVITTNDNVIDEYTTNVVAGDNAFLLATTDFQDFQSAIETKISSEISGVTPKNNLIVNVPEPESIWLLLLPLSYLLIKNMRKNEGLL